MKPSPDSLQKVTNQIRNGTQKEHDTCCTECRHALGYLIHTEQVVVINHTPVFAPQVA